MIELMKSKSLILICVVFSLSVVGFVALPQRKPTITGHLSREDVREIRRLVHRQMLPTLLRQMSRQNLASFPSDLRDYFRARIRAIDVLAPGEVIVDIGPDDGYYYVFFKGTNGWIAGAKGKWNVGRGHAHRDLPSRFLLARAQSAFFSPCANTSNEVAIMGFTVANFARDVQTAAAKP